MGSIHAICPVGLLGLLACDNPASQEPASTTASVAVVATDGAEAHVVLHGEPLEVRLFAFDLARIRLTIEDTQLRPELPSLSGDATIALATNGAFFEPNGRPRGLVVSASKELAAFDPSLSGGVLTVDEGLGRLFEAETYDASSRHEWAVQCRPRLVVAGEVNIRSDDGQRAERTTLCLRRGGRELVVGRMLSARGGPSLLAAAELLQSAGCTEALNLDGGPSTALAWRAGDGVHTEPPRGPIRHAIVVRERADP